MLVSLAWLRELTPYEGDVQQLADRLTMLGLEVEEIARPYDHLKDFVVGHVLTRQAHPEADKLSVCAVDVGEGEPLSIVCGAANVDAGQYVPVAKVGVIMPSGMAIKKAKLRGAASMGMICSESELGLAESSEGIMVLGLAADADMTPGQRLDLALGLDDTVLDLGVTPNRPDCLSHLGVARETAMAFGLPLAHPARGSAPALTESGEDASGLVAIDIPDPDLCPVYRGRVLAGATVGPSPDWVRRRLASVGVRPINNLVDATNYVCFELGQPLHAFDLDLLEGGKVRVAPAEEGMRFTTLDGQERTLSATDLLIWDGVKPVALAGVMGGANSEIHQGSSNVFLESAVFKPAVVRKTARRLALPSEASFRFERGVDQPGSKLAMDRCAALMAAWSGAAVRPGVCEAEPAPWKPRSVSFRPARAAGLMGLSETDMSPAFCKKTLEALDCPVTDGETWEVRIPSHRPDLEREVDLIEEVGRVYGVDRVAEKTPRVHKPLQAAHSGAAPGPFGVRVGEYDFIMSVKRWARGAGLAEAVNYSFVGAADLDALDLPADDRIPVMNPLSEDQGVMRTHLAPGLMKTLRHNLAQGATRLRLFELARVFAADPASETTARETTRLGVVLYGPRHEEVWPHGPDGGPDADYADIKGLVELLVAERTLGTLGAARYDRLDGHPYLAPCAAISLEAEYLGVIGRVAPAKADAFHARKEVWMADLDLEALRRLEGRVSVCFKSLPVYPPVKRDMTVLAPAGLTVDAVLNAVAGQKEKLLEQAALVDVYEPAQGEDNAGGRNLTLRLTFRHPEKTLKDKEVDKVREKVAKALQKELAVRV